MVQMEHLLLPGQCNHIVPQSIDKLYLFQILKIMIMKKLIIKLTLFALPFFLMSIPALFMPFDFFYFRFQEALMVYKLDYLFPGPFYPLQKLTMDEEGDLGHGTPFAVKKRSYWETDRFGYRKTDSTEQHDIVVIGDSCIYGNGLTQKDIFSEVLQRKLHRNVYPYAPGKLNEFIHDSRFTAMQPRVVIFEIIERNILAIDPLNGTTAKNMKARFASKMKSIMKNNREQLTSSTMFADRLLKMEQLNYFKSRLIPPTIGFRYHDLFFLQGPTAPVSADQSEINKTITIISEYNRYFKNNNVVFIFMPVPNKETIYYDLLPGKHSATILKQVLQGLQKADIPSVDLLSAFEAYKQNGGNPFQVDDSHWNSTGVTIAADLATAIILQTK